MTIFKKIEKRYIKPLTLKPIPQKMVRYQNAKEMALEIDLKKRTYAILDGKFIFGDFLEAIIVENKWKVKNLIISTLALDQGNVDSLKYLLKCNDVQNLGLIVSDFFFAFNRKALIPYIHNNLDIEDRFQFAVCRSHCKICLIETNEFKLVIHGSSNLNSSGNLEQVMIEVNNELYDFNFYNSNLLLEKYKTINKTIKREEAWHLLTGKN